MATVVSFTIFGAIVVDVQASMASMNLSASKTQAPSGDVFISYQWDIQDWVKELNNKLEKNGVKCWMDIGQMGGGDALFARIDARMQTARVGCTRQGN